jgi:hypothetical protein
MVHYGRRKIMGDNMVERPALFHRAHYNKIAALLGRYIKGQAAIMRDPDIPGESIERRVATSIAAKFVVMFAEDNPKFDEQIFLEAIVRHAEG